MHSKERGGADGHAKAKMNMSVRHIPVAQWITRWTSNPEIVGSNPIGNFFLILKICKHPTSIYIKYINQFP